MNVTSILRLDGWAGRTVLIVYGVGTTIVALSNLHGLIQPAFGIASLVLFWAALAILGAVKGDPFPNRATVALIVIAAAVTGLSSWNIVDPENAGYATWPLGAMTFVLFVLALRGRRALAWVGFAAVALVSIAAAVIVDGDVIRTVNDVTRQSATLVIGTLFALILRRSAQMVSSIHDDQRSRAAVAAAAAASASELEAQNSRLEQDARPALERILNPAPFTTQELQYFVALSATLRGGTQATGTSGERIADAVRAARVRGLAVTLIDDRGSALPTEALQRLEDALLPLLADLQQGSITVRLNPQGGSDLATMVLEENGVYRRLVLTTVTSALTS